MLRMLPCKGKGGLKANAEQGADLAEGAEGGGLKCDRPLFNRKIIEGMVQSFNVMPGPLEDALEGTYSGENHGSIALESGDPATVVV